MTPAPAMEAQLRAQLEMVGRRIESADQRGASFAEVYRLVVRENALREQLAALAVRS